MTLFDPPDSLPPPEPPVERVRLVVAYDGTGFHGFAVQPGQKTVGGALTKVIEPVVGHRVDLTCAGRTDKGVHAWGQVVSFDAAAARADPDVLARAVTKRLGPAIVVREAAVATSDFDARYSARARTYRYTVVNRPVPDPFLARVAWHVASPLDLELLQLSCDPFLGEHDFSAFCRRPKGTEPDEPLRRRVTAAAWSDLGEGVLRFEITANAFCHQMVRGVVGSIVAAGHGRLRAGDLRGILRSGDRANAAPLAPPHGLCLWHVDY